MGAYRSAVEIPIIENIVASDGEVLFGEIDKEATPRRCKMLANGGFAPARRAAKYNVTLSSKYDTKLCATKCALL